MSDTESLQQELDELQRRVAENANSIDVIYVLICGFLVFLMQAGFAMLEAGSVRTKNTKNVLLKNVIDACSGVIGFYTLGFAFASGEPSNGFIGYRFFALADFPKEDFRFFFFQYTFAATAATIVSGSVAERTSFLAYLMYTLLLTGFVYPVVAHWVWASTGWLSALSENPLFGVGMFDFAGSGVVHTVGGCSGLVGAVIVGPRLGRFDEDGRVNPMPGHSATLVTLGSFLLWFGWYGFNCGSMLFATFRPDEPQLNPTVIIQTVAVNTTLSAATAGLTVLGVVRLRDGLFDLISSLNGLLAGLVSITAGCAVVEPYAAVVIGAIGGILYTLTSWLLLLARVDDPLDAFPIHACCGVWGVIAVALFARDYLIQMTEYYQGSFGLFYGGGFRMLAGQVVGIIVIIAWTMTLLAIFFYLLMRFNLLRISPEEEMRGNDTIKHGGGAYPELKYNTRRRVVDPNKRRDEEDARLDDEDKNGTPSSSSVLP